jgi:hypothetical protein
MDMWQVRSGGRKCSNHWERGGKFAFRGKQWNEGGMMCEKWN